MEVGTQAHPYNILVYTSSFLPRLLSDLSLLGSHVGSTWEQGYIKC